MRGGVCQWWLPAGHVCGLGNRIDDFGEAVDASRIYCRILLLVWRITVQSVYQIL